MWEEGSSAQTHFATNAAFATCKRQELRAGIEIACPPIREDEAPAVECDTILASLAGSKGIAVSVQRKITRTGNLLSRKTAKLAKWSQRLNGAKLDQIATSEGPDQHQRAQSQAFRTGRSKLVAAIDREHSQRNLSIVNDPSVCKRHDSAREWKRLEGLKYQKVEQNGRETSEISDSKLWRQKLQVLASFIASRPRLSDLQLIYEQLPIEKPRFVRRSRHARRC